MIGGGTGYSGGYGSYGIGRLAGGLVRSALLGHQPQGAVPGNACRGSSAQHAIVFPTLPMAAAERTPSRHAHNVAIAEGSDRHCEGSERRSEGRERRSERNERLGRGKERRGEGSERRCDFGERQGDGVVRRGDSVRRGDGERRGASSERRSEGQERRGDGKERRNDIRERRGDGNERRPEGQRCGDSRECDGGGASVDTRTNDVQESHGS